MVCLLFWAQMSPALTVRASFYFFMYFKIFYNKSAILLITNNNFDTGRYTDFLVMKSG
jgi:hypothetical protein